MVKKIRLIEDETTVEELDSAEFRAKLLEYLQAIDWKLWEMLKIEQKRAERDGLIEPEITEPKRTKKKADVKPVIVDEDE